MPPPTSLAVVQQVYSSCTGWFSDVWCTIGFSKNKWEIRNINIWMVIVHTSMTHDLTDILFIDAAVFHFWADPFWNGEMGQIMLSVFIRAFAPLFGLISASASLKTRFKSIFSNESVCLVVLYCRSVSFLRCALGLSNHSAHPNYRCCFFPMNARRARNIKYLRLCLNSQLQVHQTANPFNRNEHSNAGGEGKNCN